jgi:release factor glutamine methyltransferase
MALDGGADGFDAYRRLLPGFPRLLTAAGVAVLELGAGQAETAAGLARRAGLDATLRPDLAGIPRALVLRRVLP